MKAIMHLFNESLGWVSLYSVSSRNDVVFYRLSSVNPLSKLYSDAFSVETKSLSILCRAILPTTFGERVVVVGSDPQLGNWDASRAHELTTSEDLAPTWFTTKPAFLPLKKQIEYKYAVINSSGEVARWEKFDGNRSIIPTGIEMTVEDDNGVLREQTRTHLAVGDQERPVPKFDKKTTDELEACRRINSMKEQDVESTINSNDTLVICSLFLPLQVRRSDKGFCVELGKTALLPSLYELRKNAKVLVKFVGLPGIEVDSVEEKREIEQLLEAHDCLPIFPPKEHLAGFLEFSHCFLLPLFHNVFVMDTLKLQSLNDSLWSSYQFMNRLWAECIVQHTHETDFIWVQDYHLLLLPLYVTRRLKKVNVGLFLHIPFPSCEIFRCLPMREEILRGMLCSDLIGFHFFEYARHFLETCKRLLGLDHRFLLGGFLSIEYGGRDIALKIGHVHIQYDEIRKKLENSSIVKEKTEQLREQFAGKFIFAAVDRCEMLAGLINKVRAFRHFLNTYPRAQGNVVLIQYAYPTIPFWHDTTLMREELIALVDKVNHDFAVKDDEDGQSLGRAEKHIFLHIRELDWEEKYALFQAADCFLDTSIRNGFNLNAFEFICCRKDQPASLILSEFTGCSNALTCAIRCNPWKIDSVASAMDRAMVVFLEEERGRFFRDQNYLQHNNTQKWAEEFLYDLRRSRKRDDVVYTSWGFGETFRVLGMDSHFRCLETDAVVEALRVSRRAVFLFDHEGTLAFDRRRITGVSGSEELFAQGTPPSHAVKKCLETILSDPRNTVIILSGRDVILLEEWFGSIKGIGLCAEHGFYYKVPAITGDSWNCVSQKIDFTWKAVALQLMMQYVKRTQGSFVENKGSALVFQYRDADPDFGSMQAKELSNYLSEIMFGYPVTVVSGKGYVEVKLRGVNKGQTVLNVLRKLNNLHGEVDFILCIGDDRSDEDMFVVVNEWDEGASDNIADYQSIRRIGSSSSFQTNRRSIMIEEGNASLYREADRKSMDLSMLTGGASHGGVGMDYFAQSNQSCSGWHFTCTVGKKPSNARYYLNDTVEVSELLELLANTAETRKMGGPISGRKPAGLFHTLSSQSKEGVDSASEDIIRRALSIGSVGFSSGSAELLLQSHSQRGPPTIDELFKQSPASSSEEGFAVSGSLRNSPVEDNR